MTVFGDYEVDAEKAASGIGDILGFFRGDMMSEGGDFEGIGNTTTSTNATTTTTPGTAMPTGATGDRASPVPAGTGVGGAYGEMRGEHRHEGVDLSVPLDTQLLAAASGRVTQSGNNDPGGYGNMVEITTPDGFVLRYGHMHGMNVKVGDQVRAGQVIGTSGGEPGGPGAGNSQGAHLHFEVRANGASVDPTPFLAGGYQIIGGTGPSGQTTTADPKAIAAVQIQNVLNVMEGKPTVDTTQQPENPEMAQGTVDTGDAGTDPDQWIRKAMAATGVDESWFAPLKARMMQESGGRNIPQGIVDVNTAQGTPAFGPMQVIEPTFRSHMLPGHEDWHNPVDNTIAAIRYIQARYGHPSKLPRGGY